MSDTALRESNRARDEEANLALQLETCSVQILQGGTTPDEAERKAKLVNQPMGSNFDGNCGG